MKPSKMIRTAKRSLARARAQNTLFCACHEHSYLKHVFRNLTVTDEVAEIMDELDRFAAALSYASNANPNGDDIAS